MTHNWKQEMELKPGNAKKSARALVRGGRGRCIFPRLLMALAGFPKRRWEVQYTGVLVDVCSFEGSQLRSFIVSTKPDSELALWSVTFIPNSSITTSDQEEIARSVSEKFISFIHSSVDYGYLARWAINPPIAIILKPDPFNVTSVSSYVCTVLLECFQKLFGDLVSVLLCE